jgi:hypothetical protein
MINYEIVKASPQQLHLQVKYTKADLPDYWINFNITDFSEENLHTVAQDGAERAKSFWENISDLPLEVALQSPTGVAKPRIYTDAPDCDEAIQNVTFEWVETDDAITQTWTVSEKSDEEKANVARIKRNSLLRETDHYGLSDVTMSNEITTYRQDLRDIPQQEDFPTTVTWPTKPTN